MEDIPEQFRVRLRNVAVVIEVAPTVEQLRECAVPDGETMYACYEGVAQVDRTIDEPMLPDRIVLFQEVLEQDFGHDPELLQREIAHTLRHEIAHHFGTSDDTLEELGKY